VVGALVEEVVRIGWVVPGKCVGSMRVTRNGVSGLDSEEVRSSFSHFLIVIVVMPPRS